MDLKVEAGDETEMLVSFKIIQTGKETGLVQRYLEDTSSALRFPPPLLFLVTAAPPIPL